MMPNRNWTEDWIEEMGLIVALHGEARFARLISFKQRMRCLAPEKAFELRECLRQRFTPSSERMHVRVTI